MRLDFLFLKVFKGPPSLTLRHHSLYSSPPHHSPYLSHPLAALFPFTTTAPSSIEFMPSLKSSMDVFVVSYFTAEKFLAATESWMQLREREANCILPLAQNYRELERRQSSSGTPWVVANASLSAEVREHYEEVGMHGEPRQLWLAVWTRRSLSEIHLDFILSCTSSHIDNLPIFLFSTHPTDTLTKEFLEPRMRLLVQSLTGLVPQERVFSVFAPNLITKSFAETWSSATGMVVEDRPYYSASLTFVTAITLADVVNRPSSLPRLSHKLRLADRGDVSHVAQHCYDFAFDSDFPIDRAGAQREALHYINSQQMWVCDVQGIDGQIDIAAIVAVTRNTLRNATITKVHTAPYHRKRGYAEALVRHVCEALLFDESVLRKHAPGYTAPYEAVCLYVAHDNTAAAIVYDRVGFSGLLGKSRPEGVENVLELGFVGAKKGYW